MHHLARAMPDTSPVILPELLAPCAYFARSFGCSSLEPFIEKLCMQMELGHVCIRVSPEETASIASSPLLGHNHHQLFPFILHHNRLYYQRYFRYETSILEFVLQRRRQVPDYLVGEDKEARREEIMNLLYPDTDPVYTLPREAVRMALSQPFCILTGGPGTGKTTTLAKMLVMLLEENPDMRTALAAPTGKAAARMLESLLQSADKAPLLGYYLPSGQTVAAHFARLQPTTIHSLLGVKGQSHYFRHDAGHPLPVDLLVVDECSMMDLALMAKLLQACGPATRVIFLGDPNQLASVEAGSVFGDLCIALPPFSSAANDRAPEEQKTPFIQGNRVALTHSWRFRAGEDIGKMSKALLNQDISLLTTLYRQSSQNDSPLHIVTPPATGYPEELLDFAAGFRHAIRQEDGTSLSPAEALQAFSRLRILCALRHSRYGVNEVNRLVTAFLRKEGLITDDPGFYEHQPILVTENLHSQGIYNGDLGILRYNEEGRLMAWFPGPGGKAFCVSPSLLHKVETAYAMTIHKSQGSEFNQVYVLVPPYRPDDTAARLLTAELLYTAITRARNKLWLQCDLPTLLQAATTRVQRSGGLPNRLTETTA